MYYDMGLKRPWRFMAESLFASRCWLVGEDELVKWLCPVKQENDDNSLLPFWFIKQSLPFSFLSDQAKRVADHNWIPASSPLPPQKAICRLYFMFHTKRPNSPWAYRTQISNKTAPLTTLRLSNKAQVHKRAYTWAMLIHITLWHQVTSKSCTFMIGFVRTDSGWN